MVEASSQSILKVLVVDDDPAVRRGLRLILRAEPGVAVVGEAGDGMEAVAQVTRLEPDVILMDVRMPRLDGLGATSLIHSRYPSIRIIVLSVYADRVEEALAAGAARFLLKDGSVESLLAAVRGQQAEEQVAGR